MRFTILQPYSWQRSSIGPGWPRQRGCGLQQQQQARQLAPCALQLEQQPVSSSGAVASSSEAQAAVARLSAACRLGGGDARGQEVVVRGSGRHQGMNCSWQLRWRCGDGAFCEEVRGREVTYRWGFDGAGRCWEVDDSGASRQLHLDDYEAVLLAGFIRTGAWAGPAGERLLEISMQQQQPVSQLSTGALGGGSGLPACANSSAVVIDQLLPPTSQPEGFSPSGEEGGAAVAESSNEFQASPSGSGSGSSSTATLTVRLKGGKVEAQVVVCGTRWHPVSMTNQVCSDVESWQFEEWSDWAAAPVASPRFPRLTLHQSGCGGLHRYEVETLSSVSAADAAQTLLASSSFSMPPTPLLPPGTRFLPGERSSVPAWYTPSGHILVRPTVNGRESGYFIFDTGASGFVIDPDVGKMLGLRAFGELHVTGMAGKVRSKFRRGLTFQLGPLLMERPLFMEMPCKGIVRGAPGPVLGIVGYELFRRTIVVVPPRPSAPPSKDTELAADSGSVSAAAAFAASLLGGKRKRSSSVEAGSEAIQYHICLLNPELGGEAVGREGTSSSSSSSSSSSQAVRLSTSGSGDEAGSLGSMIDSVDVDWEQQGSAAGAAALPRLRVPGPEWDALPWAPLTLIANLPHLEARFLPADAATDSLPRSALFMLDSGAGGVDVMFNARAVADLEGPATSSSSSAEAQYVKGVGSEGSNRVRVSNAWLAWLEMAGARFEGVRALLARSEGGASGAGIDLSAHTSGIICGDLLSRCRVVFDYPRSRLALVPVEGRE